jgi:GxxExxY protein
MSQPYVKAGYTLSDVTARIIAAAQEVHRMLGPGFMEVIYQRSLARELPAHGLEFSREVWIDVSYKGENVGKKRVDFVIGTSAVALSVMLEMKAKAAIEDVDVVQALSYLKASGYPIGLLLNFGAPVLQIKRLANERRSNR